MSRLTEWIVTNTGTLCIGVAIGVSMVLPAGAVAQEPPKVPTCEEQIVVIRAYAGEADKLLTYLRTRLAETEAALHRVQAARPVAEPVKSSP